MISEETARNLIMPLLESMPKGDEKRACDAIVRLIMEVQRGKA